MKLSKKKLALSVVVTVALLPGCGNEPIRTANPPPPDNLHINPPPTPSASESSTPPKEVPPDGDTKTDGLRDPKPNEKVERRADNTCWVYPNIDCPPPESGMTCNPPPPTQVKCP
jgi:hypothetical protein